MNDCDRCCNEHLGIRHWFIFQLFYSHSMVQINIDNDFPVELCDKHKNFKPNKAIVWMQNMWFVYWRNPRYTMKLHDISYKEALIKYFEFKLWQRQVQGRK